MRLRNIPEAKGIVENSKYVIHDPASKKGAWHVDGRPLMIEIGMGKGRFIIEMALRHPECDYLGMEMYESVLFRACERMEGILYSTPLDKLEQEHEENEQPLPVPQNLHFLRNDARLLPDIFAEGELDRIYLNFSDPWPKARHAKRRLTSRQFLARYEQVLKDGGRIEFKTDNNGLFEFSLEEIAACPNWELVASTRDLHHDLAMNEGNIMTEYERKFSALGNKINKLIAVYHKP